MTPEARDLVTARRAGRVTQQVPLVQLDDPTYCDNAHLVLVGDRERQLLSQVVERERRHLWAMQMVAAIGATIGAMAGTGALLLHFLGR